MEDLKLMDHERHGSATESFGGLRRELGLLEATMMGVGAAVSAGIFVILGQAAEMAGPSLILSFLLCGFINIATVLSYCELGAAIPRVGGEYAYVRSAFKGLPSFLTGWFEWSSNLFYAALMVLASSYMLAYIAPIDRTLTMLVLVIVFTIINIKGIKEAGAAQVLLTLMLMVVVVLFVGIGLSHPSNPNAFEPFMPNGPLGMIAAIALIFESYLGIEAVAATQAEIKEPKKTIPRAMILSSLILILIYCPIAYVAVTTVPIDALGNSSTPLDLVAQEIAGEFGVILITIVGLTASLTSLHSSIIASSRASFAMSKNGDLPKGLARVHKRYGTPYVTTLICSLLIFAISLVGDIRFIVYSISFGFLMGFIFVNLSLMKLRRSKPDLNRPFKTPLYPLMPIIGVISSVVILAFLDILPLVFGIIWFLLGSIAYFARKNHHGRHLT